MGLLNNFRVRIVRLPVTTSTFILVQYMHIRSLNNTSFIYVLVKVLTLIAFSQ